MGFHHQLWQPQEQKSTPGNSPMLMKLSASTYACEHQARDKLGQILHAELGMNSRLPAELKAANIGAMVNTPFVSPMGSP